MSFWEARSHASGEATPSEVNIGDGEMSNDAVPTVPMRDGLEGESPSSASAGRRAGSRMHRIRSKLSRRGVVHAAGSLALVSTVTNPLEVR